VTCGVRLCRLWDSDLDFLLSMLAYGRWSAGSFILGQCCCCFNALQKAIFGHGDRVAVGRCALAEASAGGNSVTFAFSWLSWWSWSGLLFILSVAG
jgi:hypothetical protein